jgi:hypothetical protein
MNCQWVKQNLSAYIDNELSQTHRELLDAHLSLCTRCKSEFDYLLATWESLSLWEDKQPPLHLKDNVLRAVKKERAFNFIRILFPVAAVVIIALGISLLYRSMDHNDQMAVIKDQKASQHSLPVESIMIEESEVIKHFQIIEEQEFFESVEVLRNIDYLPLIEEKTNNKSSMGYYSA